jgi:beta-lactamase regulating signal transducer with metallopeptidase domain
MTAQAFMTLLADLALRGGLAIACAGGIAWLLRDRPASVRAGVWRAVLAVMLLLPLVGAVLPRWAIPVLAPAEVVQAPVAPAAHESPAVESTALPVQPVSPIASPVVILFAIWLAGALVLGARLIASHASLARLIRASHPLDPDVERACRSVEKTMGLRHRVRYCVSRTVPVPLACGWGLPTVVLPDGFSGWSAGQRHGVLVHELSHLQRRDPLWHAIGAITRVLHWYHPLMWWAQDRLRIESEHACDEAVLRSGDRPSSYAETLLAIATMRAGTVPRAALAMVRSGGLESRIDAILSGRGLHHPLGRIQRAALAALAVVLSLVVAIAQPVAMAGAPEAPSAPTPRPEGAAATDWIERASRVEPIDADFRNDRSNPVQIRSAKVRIVVGVATGSVGMTMPEVVLENVDPTRTVSEVVLALDLPHSRDRMNESIRIAPRATSTLRLSADKWSAVARTADSGPLRARIVAVEFADGSHWGRIETPAPPRAPSGKSGSDAIAPTPRPPDDTITPPSWSGSSLAAPFRNLIDPSVVIVAARTPQWPATPDGAGTTWLPSVRIENRSRKEVVAVRLRYKAEPEGHGVSGFTVAIAPGSATELRKATWIRGRAEDMTVQLLGVRFRDGTVQGSMGSRIDARWPWVEGLELLDVTPRSLYR